MTAEINEKIAWITLAKVGAIIRNGHFIYTSGQHGSVYVDKDALYPHVCETSDLCRLIAKQFMFDGIEAVVAPEKGGIILSQWVAFHLCELTGREALAFYAEKTNDGGFEIKRGGAKTKLRGKSVLVVEDVLTTGGSAEKTIKEVRNLGGNVMGLGVLCNRGEVGPRNVGDPPRIFALVNVKLDAWDEENCPLCGRGMPINTDVGKGREYVASKNLQ